MGERDRSFLEIISSKGKVKILKILLREGQVNISRLVRESGLHYNLVLRHLTDLERQGLVEEVRVGRLRLFSLKLDNPRTIALIEILKALEDVG